MTLPFRIGLVGYRTENPADVREALLSGAGGLRHVGMCIRMARYHYFGGMQAAPEGYCLQIIDRPGEVHVHMYTTIQTIHMHMYMTIHMYMEHILHTHVCTYRPYPLWILTASGYPISAGRLSSAVEDKVT